VRAAVQRLLALLRRDRLDRELEEEIAAHLELAERDARAAGLSADEARRAAHLAFGGLDQVREAHRDARSARAVESLWRDLRHGARAIRRTPVVCVTIVLILAVAIGANTAMFSATAAMLLRPLAYGDPDALVVVMHRGQFPVSPVNFDDWRRQSRSFASMGAAEYWRPNVGLTSGVERLLALRLTPDVLALLQVPPLVGRLLGEEAAVRDEREVVISHGLWQRRLGGDPHAIGRSIHLDGEAYTIVGVMPASFGFAPFWAVGAELWAPLPLATRAPSRTANSLRVFARLAPGVTVAQAQADIDAVTSRLEAEFPGTNRDVRVVPLKERVVGDTRLAVLVLMVGVGFVLLIACANVAHLLLARADRTPPRGGRAARAGRHAAADRPAVPRGEPAARRPRGGRRPGARPRGRAGARRAGTVRPAACVGHPHRRHRAALHDRGGPGLRARLRPRTCGQGSATGAG
jgi:hypothetical protein